MFGNPYSTVLAYKPRSVPGGDQSLSYSVEQEFEANLEHALGCQDDDEAQSQRKKVASPIRSNLSFRCTQVIVVDRARDVCCICRP